MAIAESMPLSLGEYLLTLRTAKRLSLREVEEATENAVSNAYLSQLEHDKIAKPSPNVLHSLATVYGASYELLMEKAGYIMSVRDKPKDSKHGRVATFAGEHLTPAEEEELLRYLAYLRSIRKSKK
jgi:transcriptional regulator with XRE-family HTH domain